jgi:nucleoside-diphosphate-sugar epimerase
MRILLTGTEGYIGCVLGPRLLEVGHDVVGLDTGYYRDGWLFSDPFSMPRVPRTLIKDLRHVDRGDLEGVDAVVHLAELSNDPLGENDPNVTFEINHEGSVRLARLAKDAGVRRFVYASSCSVYGVSDAEFVDERSPVRPQTAYAKCKVLVEQDVGALADADFCPTFLRNATAFGASPRMRFDVVLNNLAGFAWTTKKIAMTSDGTPWRPIVHILDISQAVEAVLEAPEQDVRGEIFNVGDNAANYTVKEIALAVQEVFPESDVTFGAPSADNRSYRVKFDKIQRALPSFRCRWHARDGARQLRQVFERIEMSKETFDFRAFTRLHQLQYLIRTSQIDAHFFWNKPQSSSTRLPSVSAKTEADVGMPAEPIRARDDG